MDTLFASGTIVVSTMAFAAVVPLWLTVLKGFFGGF